VRTPGTAPSPPPCAELPCSPSPHRTGQTDGHLQPAGPRAPSHCAAGRHGRRGGSNSSDQPRWAAEDNKEQTAKGRGRDTDGEVREKKGRDIRKREGERNYSRQGVLPGHKPPRIN